MSDYEISTYAGKVKLAFAKEKKKDEEKWNKALGIEKPRSLFDDSSDLETISFRNKNKRESTFCEEGFNVLPDSSNNLKLLAAKSVQDTSGASDNKVSFAASLIKKTPPGVSDDEDKVDRRSEEKVLQPKNQLDFEEEVIENEMIGRASTKDVEQSHHLSDASRIYNNLDGSYISNKHNEEDFDETNKENNSTLEIDSFVMMKERKKLTFSFQQENESEENTSSCKGPLSDSLVHKSPLRVSDDENKVDLRSEEKNLSFQSSNHSVFRKPLQVIENQIKDDNSKIEKQKKLTKRFVNFKRNCQMPSSVTVRKKRRKLKGSKMGHKFLWTKDNLVPTFDTNIVFGDLKFLTQVSDYLYKDQDQQILQSTPCPKSKKNPTLIDCSPVVMPTLMSTPQTSHHLTISPQEDELDGLQNSNLCQKSFSLFDPAKLKGRRNTQLIRGKVLEECNQNETVNFEVMFSKMSSDNCKKLGEGVYGEVFRCINEDDQTIALKVIPIESRELINNAIPKRYSEVLPELLISNELSKLSDDNLSVYTKSFIQVFRVHCIHGRYPKPLLKAWDQFHEEKTSLNDRPVFGNRQLYIAFEYCDGGIDIEHFQFNNAGQAISVLHQIVSGLAVAEETLQFEHRDLHWGNILVSTSNVPQTISYSLKNKKNSIKTQGCKASIIDFTLSRFTRGSISLYQDLANDPDLFTGDAKEDYQFEIYRMMKTELDNDWSNYKPKTNVFWIHYLVHKFLNEVKYKLPNSKLHRKSMCALRKLSHCVLNYSSSLQLLRNDLFSK